jgi:hypothetical protein
MMICASAAAAMISVVDHPSKLRLPPMHVLGHDTPVIGKQHQQDEAGRDRYPDDHCRPEERRDWVDTNEVDEVAGMQRRTRLNRPRRKEETAAKKALQHLADQGVFIFSEIGQSWSRLLLPLAASLLLLSLYRLSFPPLASGPHRGTRHQVLLMLLTMVALIVTGGLVLLDLLFP